LLRKDDDKHKQGLHAFDRTNTCTAQKTTKVSTLISRDGTKVSVSKSTPASLKHIYTIVLATQPAAEDKI